MQILTLSYIKPQKFIDHSRYSDSINWQCPSSKKSPSSLNHSFETPLPCNFLANYFYCSSNNKQKWHNLRVIISVTHILFSHLEQLMTNHNLRTKNRIQSESRGESLLSAVFQVCNQHKLYALFHQNIVFLSFLVSTCILPLFCGTWMAY